MSVKSSISLTEAQDAWARGMVAKGRYPSISAVLQDGLEMLKRERDTEEAETELLRRLLEERRKGPFVSMEESRAEIDGIIEEARQRLGL